jgi:membrane-bound inhibitor of C-type lysozyme
MKRLNFLLIVVLVVTFMIACGQPEALAQACQPAAHQPLIYQCGGGQSFTVEFIDHAKSALFTLNGKTLKLPQAMSGSGARYSDGHTTLWIKGDGAFVMEGDKIVIKDCKVKK